MRATILLLPLFLLFCRAYSQNKALIDSLNQQISVAATDSQKIKLLNELAGHYLFTSTIGTRIPAQEALRLAELTKNSVGTMDALNRLGIMNFRLSQFDSSLYFYTKGLVMAEKVNDTIRIIKFRGNIALTYSFQAKYEEALKLYLELIKIQKIFNPPHVSKSLLEIASIYYYLKDYNQALINATEAKQIAESFNDKQSLANAYNSMGTFLDELGKTNEALINYKKSYELKIQIDDKLGQINTLINIANYYYRVKAFNKSLALYDTVLMLAESIGATQQQANAHINMGNIYSDLNQYEKANKSYIMADEFYKEVGALEFEVEIAGKLGDNYVQLNDFKKASMAYREQSIFKDSLYKINMTKDIAEMRTKFETEKKEQKNLILTKENELQQLNLDVEKQNKRNLIWFFSVGTLVIVLLFLLLFNRFRIKKKSEIERQIAEQKRIGFEAVIEAEENERIRIAKDLHDGIGQQISAVSLNFQLLSEKIGAKSAEILPDIEKMKRMIAEAGADVRTISHQMMPRALTEFGLIDALDDMIDKSFANGKITCHFEHHNMEERLPQNIEIGLYRIAQELINNILKHADANQVEVQLVKKANHCILIIQDNGKGIDDAKKKGIGIQNISSRLQVINGELNLESDSHSGTTAIVRIDLTKPYGNAQV